MTILSINTPACRFLAMFGGLIALVLITGCDSATPATATTTNSSTTVGFSSVPVATPGSPAPASTYTISFTIANSTTTDISETVPYTVSVDGALVYSGVTGAIPANGTLVVTSGGITAGEPGQYQISVALDPNNTTGLVSSGGGSQTITLTVLPIIGTI